MFILNVNVCCIASATLYSPVLLKSTYKITPTMSPVSEARILAFHISSHWKDKNWENLGG